MYVSYIVVLIVFTECRTFSVDINSSVGYLRSEPDSAFLVEDLFSIVDLSHCHNGRSELIDVHVPAFISILQIFRRF